MLSHAKRFGRVELRPAERLLLIDARPAALGARAFDLLLALVELELELELSVVAVEVVVFTAVPDALDDDVPAYEAAAT